MASLCKFGRNLYHFYFCLVSKKCNRLIISISYLWLKFGLSSSRSVACTRYHVHSSRLLICKHIPVMKVRPTLNNKWPQFFWNVWPSIYNLLIQFLAVVCTKFQADHRHKVPFTLDIWNKICFQIKYHIYLAKASTRIDFEATHFSIAMVSMYKNKACSSLRSFDGTLYSISISVLRSFHQIEKVNRLPLLPNTCAGW